MLFRSASLRELKFVNSEYYISDALNSGKRILAEGAQGAMLDIDSEDNSTASSKVLHCFLTTKSSPGT